MALNAKQKRRRRRRRRAEMAALFDPGATLSGRSLRRAANTLTRMEAQPQRAALRREMQQANRQGSALADRASDYYTQLATLERDNVARQQAIGGELQTRLKGLGDESQAGLSAIEAEAQQRAAQDEAVRGAGLGGGGAERVAAEIAAQKGLAQSGTRQAQEAGELSTANWANLANVAAASRGLQGGETLSRIQNALSGQQADIRGRQSDLETQVAQKRMANLLDLRQQGYENLVTAEGLGIDRAKLRTDAQLERERLRSNERQNRARVRAQRRGQDITMRGQDMTAEQRAADRRARERIATARKKGTKLESSDARKLKIGISNAFADLRDKNPKNPSRWLRKQGAPGIVIRAARERAEGGLTDATYNELKRLGVKVPKGWRRSAPGQVPIIGNVLDQVLG